jgi:hypothetical protein
VKKGLANIAVPSPLHRLSSMRMMRALRLAAFVAAILVAVSAVDVPEKKSGVTEGPGIEFDASAVAKEATVDRKSKSP